MVIETMAFRLAEGVDEAAFLDADRRVQALAHRQEGILRRTLARGVGGQAGTWVVVDLWAGSEWADACAARWGADPDAQAFMALVDRSSLDVRRYEALD